MSPRDYRADWERIKADPKKWEREKTRRRDYYWKHRDSMLKQQKEYIQKLREAWNGVKQVTREIRGRAEVLGQRILSKKGYLDIQRMSWEFPFDYMAKRDGRIYLVEVTTARVKRLRKGPISRSPRRLMGRKWNRKGEEWRLDWDRMEMARYLGVGLIVIFVRPTLAEYCILTDPNPQNKERMVYFYQGEHGQV